MFHRLIKMFNHLLFLPATGWAVFAGALAGLSFDVLFKIAKSPEGTDNTSLWIALLFFISAAWSFATVSAAIEEKKAKVSVQAFPQQLSLGGEFRSKLIFWIRIAALSLLLGLIGLFWGK